MEKQKWKRRIKKACQSNQVYKDSYDDIIDTLASILEKRDAVEQQYIDTGEQPVIIHTNKAGAPNVVKNPMLVLWDDLNKSALAYWRDLGLTPAGLKKLGEPVAQKKEMSLMEAVRSLGQS